MMKRFILIFLFIQIIILSAYATHNRAGQIIYRHISGYTYEVEIWTYTYTKSAADRDSLRIAWGDGTSKEIPRVQKNVLPNFYFENKYVGRHTYSGPGTFKLVTEDPNRNEGVKNIPNSVNVVFALTTILQINPFFEPNNAPILYTRPIDKAAVGRIFVHNPGAYDPDGDSLSYGMDTCRHDNGEKIPGFSLPPSSKSISVDPKTGDLTWDTPTQIGIYNVAMRIDEWRNGIKISSIVRDIQIDVEETENNPPIIDPTPDICVIAGDTVKFSVTAKDPDNDIVYLEATGAPMQMEISPATFLDSIHNIGTVTGKFEWKTKCEHIKKIPYIVTFKATDDNPEVQLTDYQTSEIKIIGPAVQFKSIENSNTNVILKWNKAKCPNATGYNIYRRNQTENFAIEECQTGIPTEWGYTLIKEINNPNTLFYINSFLTPGFAYCYRIVATYNNNRTEGQPSEKICAEIKDGTPILTKASVINTNTTSGKIQVEWIEPKNLDTTTYPGPYRYQLYISRDLYGVNYNTPIAINGLHSTSYADEDINTQDNPSCYKLILQNYDNINNKYIDIGSPSIASSPYITIKSENQRNIIHITENVPWENIKYVIYRYNNSTGTFDSIATTTQKKYTDNGLENHKEYCYKIKSISQYTATNMPKKIINFSQETCGTPIDTIPPCCPKFNVQSICDEYKNIIKWKMPADTCYEGIDKYIIYYSPRLEEQMTELIRINGTKNNYQHSPEKTIAGCYTVSAIDSAGNIATCNNNKQCVDICSYYKLPNIFTPNKDGINDLYHPYPYKFVENIDIKIYNRWGDIVFETTDPDINWDGKDNKNNKLVAEGVYYYICDVYEKRLSGIVPRNISGFIHIYYQKEKNKP